MPPCPDGAFPPQAGGPCAGADAASSSSSSSTSGLPWWAILLIVVAATGCAVACCVFVWAGCSRRARRVDDPAEAEGGDKTAVTLTDWNTSDDHPPQSYVYAPAAAAVAMADVHSAPQPEQAQPPPPTSHSPHFVVYHTDDAAEAIFDKSQL